MNSAQWPRTRRALLVAAAVSVSTLAGCSGRDERATAGTATGTKTDADTDGGADASTDATEPVETPDPAETTEESTTELDLREANVTAVAFETRDDGVRFDVTLYHDDDGEDGYANWWQVERLDGTRLGRRDLLHAHGTREFTRSATVEIPDGVSCVVVRGHDETHGYGGRATLVNLGSGAVRGVEQGPDPREFDADDCP